MSVGPAVTYQVQSDVWLDGCGPVQTSADPHHPLSTSPCIWVRRGTLVMIVPGSPLAARYGGMSNLAPLPATQVGDIADHSCLGN